MLIANYIHENNSLMSVYTGVSSNIIIGNCELIRQSVKCKI